MSEHSGSKYHRPAKCIKSKIIAIVDVYAVLRAFNVTEPGLQHAIKKLLCAGIRGKGGLLQDLQEAIDAVQVYIDHVKTHGG